MNRLSILVLCCALPAAAQEYKMAVIGLVHAHVWGHLQKIVNSKEVKLVGVADPNPILTAEAKKLGVTDDLIASDYRKMLDERKPDLVWAFVENNRHLEIVQACAPKKINVIFEKPLAATHAQALEIQKLANQYGIKVMSNYQMAWWPANYTAKKLADSGDLGQVWRLHGVVGHGGPGSQGPRNEFFFAWLTDPVKNGAGALMDFGCYNALWSLWYMGRPETVYAHVNHLRPETFPKVEDNSDMVLGYKNGVGMFEGSWDLPKSYQDLEVFGLKKSVYMQNGKVTEKAGREVKEIPIEPLAPEDADPVSYMVSRMRSGKAIEGMTALDINVQVLEIIDAAKESIATGTAVKLK
ncbi:MAG: Gfo/Idh/MocA family oxidoreductase [Acidobacteriota bacterium]|nr:Gfo/Idh/MocA family oxidoreductase [Acidobacteriota bacterium]